MKTCNLVFDKTLSFELQIDNLKYRKEELINSQQRSQK